MLSSAAGVRANGTKFLKRQMFGQTHLDLLQVKVLHAV